MTEDEARAIVGELIDADAMRRLELLVRLVLEENKRQNLIARSTETSIWWRHILDSVQLLRFAPSIWNHWIDIGTGGGFPGLALACSGMGTFWLVEPRALRAGFLEKAADALGLPHVRVLKTKAAALRQEADLISARAVTYSERLLQDAKACATATTRWLFLRGRQDDDELSQLGAGHRGMMFHVEQSLSQKESVVLIGNGIPS